MNSIVVLYITLFVNERYIQYCAHIYILQYKISHLLRSKMNNFNISIFPAFFLTVRIFNVQNLS